LSQPAPKDAEHRHAGFADVPVRITVRVASARCPMGRLFQLAAGDVLPLPRRLGEPFELLATGVLLGLVAPLAEQDGVALKLVSAAEDEDAAGG
jgi:hypothetical protein